MTRLPPPLQAALAGLALLGLSACAQPTDGKNPAKDPGKDSAAEVKPATQPDAKPEADGNKAIAPEPPEPTPEPEPPPPT